MPAKLSIDEAVKGYRSGELSLRQACHKCQYYLGEFMAAVRETAAREKGEEYD